MQEGKLQFTLDYEYFGEILSQENWFKLQHEFENKDAVLSQSFLIWEENSSSSWLLADFETEKTYDIKGNLVTEKPDSVVVSESSNQKGQLINLTEPYSIISLIEQNPKGTDEGYVEFLTKLNINLSKFNLDQLKRSDLSGAGFSFESAYRNLLIVHKKFCEILTTPNELLVDISRGELKTVVTNLKQFYGYAKQIADFEIKVENPSENYNRLLGTISKFCENMKEPLKKHIVYLNSSKIEQLEDQIKTALDTAEERVNTAISSETERLQKIGDEGQQNEEKRQENFSQLENDVEDLIRKKSISSYEKIFADQTEEHRKGAKLWLSITSLLAVGFSLISWWLIKDLAPAGSQLPAILQNLIAKGFFLSLIYLLLNRSIKNYTAEKHLQTVNRHRQNALATFEEFEKAAGKNQETRDAVLLACTDAIFDANQSGYLSTKTSRSESAAPIQMVKGFVPTKPPTDSD